MNQKIPYIDKYYYDNWRQLWQTCFKAIFFSFRAPHYQFSWRIWVFSPCCSTCDCVSLLWQLVPSQTEVRVLTFLSFYILLSFAANIILDKIIQKRLPFRYSCNRNALKYVQEAPASIFQFKSVLCFWRQLPNQTRFGWCCRVVEECSRAALRWNETGKRAGCIKLQLGLLGVVYWFLYNREKKWTLQGITKN